MDEERLRRLSRRAYELGRLRWAVQHGLWVVPVGLGLLLVAAPTVRVVTATALLWLLVAAAAYWRTAAGRGAVAGSLVGLVPVLLGVMMMGLKNMTPSQCYAFCISGSFLLGAFAGFALARRASFETDGRLEFCAAALVTAGIAAVVGCTAVGFGSLAGLATGVLLIGLPTFVLTPPRLPTSS